MNQLINFKTFENISIGDKASFEVTISEETHLLFSKVSGDNSPIHTLSSFASNTSFQKKIGYGFLLTSYISQLYGKYLPGGSSICIKQECNFIKPYFIGDKLVILGEVVGKYDSTHFLEIKSTIYRLNNIKIFEGLGIVQVLFDKN